MAGTRQIFWEWILWWPHQLFCITHWHRCEEILGAEMGSRLASGLWLRDELSPCSSSPNLSSCSNPSPGRGHTWSFGHMNLAKFPETVWTSHLQETSGVSCSWGYLNLGLSSGVSRRFAIRQLLTSFQQLFSSTAHVIFPTPLFIPRDLPVCLAKYSASQGNNTQKSKTEHSLLIKSKLLILLSAPRPRT